MQRRFAQSPVRARLAGMTSLIEFLASQTVQDLATPANARLGRELVDGGEVEIFEVNGQRLGARVGGVRASVGGLNSER